MQRTARQAAHEVFLMKQQVELDMPGAPAKHVMSVLLAKSTPARNHEFTLNYIQSALAVYAAVCCVPGIVLCLNRLENIYLLDSCFNSLSKLFDIVRKCDSAESCLWVFEGVVDGIESMTFTNISVTRCFLIGGKHEIGLVSLLQFKRRCLHYFLDVELPRSGFRLADLAIIREALANHCSYRSGVTSLPGQPSPDRRWIGKLADSSQSVMWLLEERFSCLVALPFVTLHGLCVVCCYCCGRSAWYCRTCCVLSAAVVCTVAVCRLFVWCGIGRSLCVAGCCVKMCCTRAVFLAMRVCVVATMCELCADCCDAGRVALFCWCA